MKRGAEDPLTTHLGDAIRRRRAHLRLTIIEVSEASGVNYGFISQLERGINSVSVATLGRLAVGLETTPSRLLAAAERSLKKAGLPLTPRDETTELRASLSRARRGRQPEAS